MSASLVDQTPQNWLARAVFGLDVWLRHRRGVFEYTSDPDCIFRVEIAHIQHPVALSDGITFDTGDRVLLLHLWSEHIPAFPAAGATLTWARGMNRLLDRSLRELAAFLAERPDFADIRAIRAEMTFGTPEQTAQLLRICGRFGFRPVRQAEEPGLATRLHHLGENILIALMILARNPKGFRLDCMRRNRVDVFLSRAVLDGRYRVSELVQR